MFHTKKSSSTVPAAVDDAPEPSNTVPVVVDDVLVMMMQWHNSNDDAVTQ